MILRLCKRRRRLWRRQRAVVCSRLEHPVADPWAAESRRRKVAQYVNDGQVLLCLNHATRQPPAPCSPYAFAIEFALPAESLHLFPQLRLYRLTGGAFTEFVDTRLLPAVLDLVVGCGRTEVEARCVARCP